VSTGVPETRYARTTDGLDIAYQTLGSGGVDVLKLAAYFGNIEHNWESRGQAHVNRTLAELGRLIVFDGRGTGLSDRLTDGRLPTLQERIDDIRGVLDAVGSQRTVLTCFADSGPLGILFAATYPERTRALVLINATPRTAWAPDHPWGMTPEQFDAELESTMNRWGTRAYAAEIVAIVTPEHPDDESMIEWFAKSMRLSASPRAAADLLRMYYEMDVRDVLPVIHVPTLVLASTPALEQATAMASAIPGAELEHIDSVAPTAIANPDLYLAEIRRFVHRIEHDEADLDRVLQTVLFTDIVGSTERAAAAGDHAWRQTVEAHHRLVRGMLTRWRGREMDTAGDGFFAAFDGPARAIRCAQAIVSGVHALGIEVRAGLHTGECDIVDGKVAGITVAIGARIAAKAAPSEVLVSQTVTGLVAGSDIAFEDAGQHVLKGVRGEWRLFRVAA
jgi:class 3 adenylate cyclase/pimeloyl-ACP methyl ester carboxylesterase